MAHRQKGTRKSVLDYTLESRTELNVSDEVWFSAQMAEGGMGLIMAGNDRSGLE